MYEICKFCGASSTTSDKCSNCGAPIEKSDDGPVPYENSKIRDAIEKHYEEVGRRGYIIKSGRNETLITTIYIDDKRAFEVRSSNGNIGGYSVFANHQDLTIALTNLSKRKSVLLPGKTKCFGDDKNELVATISELLAEIDPTLSDNRIRIDSYATRDSSIVRLSLILITIATYISGISGIFDNGVEASFIIAIFGTCSYILFAPLQTNKNDRHYTLELFTKIVSVLTLGIVVFVPMIDSAYYFAGIDGNYWFGWRNAATCLLIYFLVVGIYSYIQTFIILCKKGYKYYGILLIPMLNIMVLAFASAGGPMRIFTLVCLMVSMLIQTILISVVNERRERLG